MIAGPVDQGQKALERVLAIVFTGVGVWGRYFVGGPFWGGVLSGEESFLGEWRMGSRDVVSGGPFWEGVLWDASF